MEEETEEVQSIVESSKVESYPRGHSETIFYFKCAKDIQIGLAYLLWFLGTQPQISRNSK